MAEQYPSDNDLLALTSAIKEPGAKIKGVRTLLSRPL